MKRSEFLYGLHIGEHGFEPDQIEKEIKENCIDRGMNFVTIRTPKRTPVEKAHFLRWAKYLAENRVYFIFLYTIQFAPWGQDSQFTPQLVREMKEIAGEYFLGDMLGELGSVFCGKMPGYFVKGHAPMPPQRLCDMQTAKDNYVKAVREYMEIERSLGMEQIGVAVVEATTLSCYNMEAGTTLPIVELMGQDPEPVLASVRGAAKAYHAPRWGTYIAHEWYAGHYHDDALKRKRLELEYKHAYMNGTQILCHESGDDVISAYGRNFSPESEISTECRNFINDFGAFIKKDPRPEGGPVAKVAFLQGNLDSWLGIGRNSICTGSSVWSQFEGEEWGNNTPEWSWNVLDEIGRKRRWWEFDSYACHGEDHSALPPYGSYDILPACAPLDVMCSYDTLIFCGWNTMTEELLCKLEQFVAQGGTLLASAAHLNAASERSGKRTLVREGDLRTLFGCRVSSKSIRFGGGSKFRADSAVPGVCYPRSLDSYCDPLFSAGFVEYAEVELCGATAVATAEDSFHFYDQPGFPTVIEHRLGKGVAILMTSLDYPGNGAVYPLYRFMVKELLRAGVGRAAVRVQGPDALRYTVYADGTVYLLNTDFDNSITAQITARDFCERVTLAPLEMHRVQTGIFVD